MRLLRIWWPILCVSACEESDRNFEVIIKLLNTTRVDGSLNGHYHGDFSPFLVRAVIKLWSSSPSLVYKMFPEQQDEYTK